MKSYLFSKILLTSFLCFSMFLGFAQEAEKKKMTPEEKKAYADKRAGEEYKNIEAAYLNIFRKANLAYKDANPQTCNAFSYVKNLKEDRFITEGFRSETILTFQKMFDLFSEENRKNLIGSLMDENKKNLEIDVDKGGFKTLLDKLIGASSNSKDFPDFVFLFTGQDIGYISKNDLAYLKVQYDKSKRLRAAHLYSAYEYEDYIEYSRKDCSVYVVNSIRETKKKYPNSEWLFTSEITYNCGCQEGSDQTTLNKAAYKYTGKVTSLSTAADIVFSKSVTDPKLSISNVVCCPEKKEEDNKIGHLTESKNPWAISGEASAALPIGDEADFVGIGVGATLVASHYIGDDFAIGASAGYLRYSGKETDFGFETEGESFIPLKVLAAYDLSNAFGIEAGLGYALSASEGGEGGLMYSAGPFWRPLETLLIALNYVNISFGEGSLGAVMLSGRFSLSKK